MSWHNLSGFASVSHVYITPKIMFTVEHHLTSFKVYRKVLLRSDKKEFGHQQSHVAV